MLLVMVAVACYFAARPHVRAYYAMQELSNDDMIVNGSTFGLLVFIEGPASETLLELGTDANGWLLDALSNENQFAAAHYLLMRINHDEFVAAKEFWDDYHLDPFARGSTDFDVSLMPGIRSFWTKLLSKSDEFSEADRPILFSYFEEASFSKGDLVPCSKQDAEFLLTIQAYSDQKLLVSFEQGFRHHQGPETKPTFEFGISPQRMEDPDLVETKACTPPIQGVFQYSFLKTDRVGMKIDWRITDDAVPLRFRSEFEVKTGETGAAPSRDLATGEFKWSFKKHK